MSTEKKYVMDMCHGPLFSKILRYVIPLIIANIVALLFHAAAIASEEANCPRTTRSAA